MTDSHKESTEAEKLRLFSRFLRESPDEQSSESQRIVTESIVLEGVTYILTGNTDGFGPSLLIEVEDVDGYRYFVQRWRVPLDDLPGDPDPDIPLVGYHSPSGEAYAHFDDVGRVKVSPSCDQAGS